jgi:surface antigen
MIPSTVSVSIVALLLAACAQTAGDPARYQGLTESDVTMASRQVQTTLESAPDGTTRRWTNQQTGNSGEVTPLRTYATEDGDFCREYREELVVGGRTGRFHYPACRDDADGWVSL